MDVLKSNVGKKDLHKGLFSVWNSIFQVWIFLSSHFYLDFIIAINPLDSTAKENIECGDHQQQYGSGQHD
jgi:hypothetical protein